MLWHVFSAIRGIVVGVFLTEYRKKRYSTNRRSTNASDRNSYRGR